LQAFLLLTGISDFFDINADGITYATVYNTVLRFVFPALALWILLRCIRSLLSFRKEPEIWGWLNLTGGILLPVTHWENMIGRSRRSDIVVDFPTVSKSHAVLTRYDDGSWTVSDIGSRGGVEVNGKSVSICALNYGDVISLAGVEMTLEPVTEEDKREGMLDRTRAGRLVYPGPTLLLLTLFQLLTALQLMMHVDAAYVMNVAASFAVLAVLQWALFFALKAMRRSGYEIETIAFFMTTIGLAVIASSAPGEMFKDIAAIVLGIVIYLVVGWSLRDLERAKKLRYAATVLGLGLLLATIVFGRSVYGARNWIYIGSMSFQPSELAKLCFIFVGASTMDRMVTKRNLILFIAYSAAVCGCLALMSDFGTAVIFFVAFLVIAFLRSGSFATVSLSLAATGFAGSLALSIKPYIKKRFQTWGHVWEYALTGGYQQTRALMCIASGGLFGLGAGCGWLKHVAAADTDLVFAFVCEEWGLIVALLLVVCIAILCFFVVRSSSVARSSFYTIGACAAASILIIQTILNVFGTVDFLPLTGVTFPFVSNGGSSMLSAWGLLAFIKAADTRQNASFAVKLAQPTGKEPEE
jgi:cell division protein FtsW (lipid II flippase)